MGRWCGPSNQGPSHNRVSQPNLNNCIANTAQIAGHSVVVRCCSLTSRTDGFRSSIADLEGSPMKLSRTVAYALQATLQLADVDPNVPVPCSKLAAEGGMPERFLLQILRN